MTARTTTRTSTRTTARTASTRRTGVRLAVTALLGAALVPALAPPASATPGCLSEKVPSLLQDGCDDSTPPETTVVSATPPNAAGMVAAPTMSFTVTTQVSDGDAGPFTLECRLTGSPQAHDWRPCVSPVTYVGLPDAAAGSYVFEARSVDQGDRPLNPDNPLGLGTVADTPDLDETPATVRWGQDSTMPFVFVTSTTYDEITPTQPVVLGRTVPLRVNTSEPGSTLECTDNGKPVACTAGRWELPDPAPGRHTFLARTVDAAGNASAWSAPVEFFVPRDFRRARGWSTVQDAGYVRGDALRATTRGARLVVPRTTVGELRLVAPTGPGYGKVRMRVGRRDWHVVNLSGPRSGSRQFVVIDRYSGLRTGRIVLETLSRKPVVVDAVVARPNTFPPATRVPLR